MSSRPEQFIAGYGGRGGINFNSSYLNQNIVTNLKMLPIHNLRLTRTHLLASSTPFFTPYSDPDKSAHTKIITGKQAYDFSGNISFQLTQTAVKKIFSSDFMNRSNVFQVAMFDGEKTCKMVNCVWNSVEISGGSDSIVTCNISFLSTNGFKKDLTIDEGSNTLSVIEDTQLNAQDILVPYWQCGLDQDIVSFSLTFQKPVTSIHLNNSYNAPTYLRTGIINISLTVQSFKTTIPKSIVIYVGSKVITFNSTNELNKQCNINSLQDSGTVSYTWNSISDSSTSSIFTIV